MFQVNFTQLLSNMKNVDQRKPTHVGPQIGTLPADWKQRDCFSDLGEFSLVMTDYDQSEVGGKWLNFIVCSQWTPVNGKILKKDCIKYVCVQSI